MGLLNKTPLLALLLLAHLLPAQDVAAPIHGASRQWAERLSVLSGQPLDMASLPLLRNELAAFASNCTKDGRYFDRRDQAGLRYLLLDNNDYFPADSFPRRAYKSHWMRHFYPHKAHLFEVNQRDFVLRADPVLHVSTTRENGRDGIVFANQRGAEVRARIGQKIHFYTSILETQANYATYAERWIQRYTAVPGNGLYKTYTSSVSDLTGYDYNNSSAYLAAPLTKQIGFQFGHGRNFIGHGERSLFLSDFSNNYLYLKFRSKFWRFTYENYFLNLNESLATSGTEPTNARRFAAMHHLNLRLGKRFNIGIFEGVAFKRSGGPELQYFNPVILYRSVEYGFKSADNVILGADMDFVVANRVKVYGQFLLDEFLFASIYQPDQKGWWGNKFGTQLGLKYYNALGIDHLDLQIEYNQVRPYTYSHGDSLSNWTHFGQPLAHPLGSNFRETMAIARYQITPKWSVQARFINIIKGDDEGGNNWGGDPNLTYATRPREYGNYIGQGDRTQIGLLGVDVSWQFAHNMFLDAKMLYRKQNNNLQNNLDLTTNLLGLGVRMNYFGRDLDF